MILSGDPRLIKSSLTSDVYELHSAIDVLVSMLPRITLSIRCFLAPVVPRIPHLPREVVFAVEQSAPECRLRALAQVRRMTSNQLMPPGLIDVNIAVTFVGFVRRWRLRLKVSVRQSPL